MSAAKPPKPYVRLARARGGISSYNSLWLGSDHLLDIASTGYTERYQRFYLHEIKGLFVTHTRHALITTLVSGVIVLAAGIPAVVTILHGKMPIMPWFFLVPSVIFLLLGGLMGRNCRVHVMTGVQTVQLPALSRRRRVAKVFARLRPLIETAQAGLVTEEPMPTSALSPEPPALPPQLS